MTPMILEAMIGETAEIIAGRLAGRIGTVVAFDGEYATLQTRTGRMTVHLDDIELDDYLVNGAETTSNQPPVCSIDDWEDPYAEKT